MHEFNTIEIDFEVHKRIEMERQSFSESPNAALRRLLKIDIGQSASTASGLGQGRSWSGKGVTLPAGTELKMEYNGRLHTGMIVDGAWVIEGDEYKSPSAAASGVARTKAGNRTNLDGWVYWQVKRPGEPEWICLAFLKK